jgi:hypothetical protein
MGSDGRWQGLECRLGWHRKRVGRRERLWRCRQGEYFSSHMTASGADALVASLRVPKRLLTRPSVHSTPPYSKDQPTVRVFASIS